MDKKPKNSQNSKKTDTKLNIMTKIKKAIAFFRKIVYNDYA